MVVAKLLDARTPDDVWAAVEAEMKAAQLVGIDCETQDEARHAGLNIYNNETRHVFDHRRTVMTGFSLYADGAEHAYYVNLAHTDVENRVSAERALRLIPQATLKVAHNAPFELVMFEQCHGVKLENVVCTLQLAVSHHGPDEYDWNDMIGAELVSFRKFAKDVLVEFANYDPGTRGQSLTSSQAELLSKFIAKESKAEHSYNGFVKSLAKGYNLKRLTKSRFGIDQMSYKQLLKDAGVGHMGELTGEQVCAYGTDDAYWAVQHFKWLRDDMLVKNPAAFVTFLKTENPMVQVYADTWRKGLRLNLEEVFVRQRVERVEMANVLRRLKPLVRSLLPFSDKPCQALIDKQSKWYVGFDNKTGAPKDRWKIKRAQITAWASSSDADDDFEQVFQVSNPVGNAWAEEKGITVPKQGKLNIGYYESARVLLYDLMEHRLVYDAGEVSSDKEARGKILDTFQRNEMQAHVSIMLCLQEMAEIEQRMKLYLTPYTQLMDPETSRVYPSLSSQLATRRLAASFPNPMQLAKQGNSTYIRGFYLADSDDEVVISADWSAIELVLIGDQSGDPGFGQVYGQLPYGDMHTGAAVDGLSVKTLPGLTEEEFREFKFGRNPNNRMLKNCFTQIEMDPASFYKFMRGTPCGKGINFSYWYSGALSTVGQNLGWSSDEMWEAVDRYRERFPVAEQWRVRQGEEVAARGFITLPDGHRRVRLEAMPEWFSAMRQKFVNLSAAPAMVNFAELALRRIASRAKNQAVNAQIQGTCATLAKRSILRIEELCREAGIGDLVRFMIPIHDELVFSVHKSAVMLFIPLLRRAMCEHPDIVRSLPLSCNVALGRTFRPFDKLNPAFSQIELDEVLAPIEGVIGPEWEGKKLPDDKVAEVVEFVSRARLAA